MKAACLPDIAIENFKHYYHQIDLDPAYYRFVDRFENHFPFGAPSLVDCESLTIRGDVRFGSQVKLEGWAALSNTGRKSYAIEDRQRIRGALRV
jgi:UTP--glucose-1-phosphate uridylyltransferase